MNSSRSYLITAVNATLKFANSQYLDAVNNLFPVSKIKYSVIVRKALVEVNRKLLDCLKQAFIGLAQDVYFFQLFQLGFWKIATPT